MDLKYTIEGEENVLIAEAEDVIKKSVFTAYLYNVSDEEQIFNIINKIRGVPLLLKMRILPRPLVAY